MGIAVIRSATHDDIAAICSMARKFYATTEYARAAPMDDDSVSDLVAGLIDDGVVLIAFSDGEPVGMIALVVTPFMFNRNVLTAHEVAWWVDPSVQRLGVGSTLLEMAESACRDAGAVSMQMVTLSTSPPAAAKTYLRAGFEHTETCFTKGL